MLNVIHGANASGKSKVLLDMAIEKQSESTLDMVSNIIENPEFNKIAFDDDRVEVVRDVLICEDIRYTNYEEIKSDEIGNSLREMLTYLCKAVRNVYLDEPDLKLNEAESIMFYNVLFEIRHSIENLCVVSHHSVITSQRFDGAKYWHVEMRDNKFVLVEEDT